MTANRKLTVKYCFLQGAYWMLAAVGLVFITPLLEAKGFSSVEIGGLNAVKYISVIVFQILLASFCDKHAKTVPLVRVMRILGIIGILSCVLFWYCGHNIIEAVIVFILFGIAVNCLSPIVDSLSIQYLNHGREFNYSVSRATGSGCWAVASVFIGMFADCYGTNNILLLQVGATIFFMIITYLMDPVDFSKEKSERKEKEEIQKNSFEKYEDKSIENTTETRVHSSWFLLRNYPKYTLFLLGCMIIFLGYSMNATFLIDAINALGGSHSDLGIAEFVLAAAEMPVAIFFYKMRKKVSIEWMMVVCALFCTLRATAVTYAPTVTFLIIFQSLEILGLAIFYPGCAYFVMENLPEADVVKGVSFINVATVGIGQAIASVVSGFIMEHMGVHNLMIISSLVSFLSVIIMIVMVFAPKKRKHILE